MGVLLPLGVPLAHFGGDGVAVWHDADESSALLETACDVAQHRPNSFFALESVVHAEHHADDVKAAAAWKLAARLACVVVDTDFSDYSQISNPLSEAVFDDETGVEDWSSPASHLLVSFVGLTDTRICRVEADV